jgi:hypothetical protein
VRPRTLFIAGLAAAALLATAAARTTAARLNAASLLLMSGRSVDAVADVVIDKIVVPAAGRQVGRLHAHVDVALAESEEPCASLVNDLDLHLVQLAAELVERHLDGFLAGLRCRLNDPHFTSCLLWPPTSSLRPGAPNDAARERVSQQADVYFRFGRFLSAFAISFLRC